MSDLPQFRRAAKAKPRRDPERPAYITLYLREATYEALRAVRCDRGAAPGGLSRAARISRICDRYAALVGEAMPVLSEAQWCGLMDILNPGIGEEFRTIQAEDEGLADLVRVGHQE